ncbi:MAG: ATP-binding protein [Bryobacteraceae bacterium]
MYSPLQNRLQLQLFLILLAALSVATLSVLLITEAIRSTETVLVSETNRTVSSAIRELSQQYRYRVSSDSTWNSLPRQAKEVSLRGITQIVLRAYPGVEGGFYTDSNFAGYAFPTHDAGTPKIDLPSAERDWILSVVNLSFENATEVERVFRGGRDLLVIEAVADRNRGFASWAMKRLSGRNDPGIRHRAILLSALVLAALFSVAGTLAVSFRLAHGVRQIQNGLAVLEEDFDYRLPEFSGELGAISKSINQMASTRGRLEKELRREDRLRAVGRLAAGLAHEIRNPLNSIRLTVQLLEHRLKSNAIRAQDLATIRSEVDRMSLLLSDLLDLQRSRRPHVEVQKVVPVVEHCLELIEKQAEMQGTVVHLETQDRNLYASFDSQQLTQALVNLLLNALEAAPEGGTVSVRASNEDGSVHVSVQDDGPGLSAEQQDHLFEAFYSTKANGTGLGLAVSRELLRSQGGDLIYRPAERGARFVIELSRS